MSEWGRRSYGDPCGECGFEWSIDEATAIAVVDGIARRFDALIGASDGSARHPDLVWSAREYVCHVVDNLRIWAERLAASAAGSTAAIAPYDTDLLARARCYDHVPVEGALWSLTWAARSWTDAVAAATARGAVLVHPERGALVVTDIVRTNAHDAHHHAWDIARIVGSR